MRDSNTPGSLTSDWASLNDDAFQDEFYGRDAMSPSSGFNSAVPSPLHQTFGFGFEVDRLLLKPIAAPMDTARAMILKPSLRRPPPPEVWDAACEVLWEHCQTATPDPRSFLARLRPTKEKPPPLLQDSADVEASVLGALLATRPTRGVPGPGYLCLACRIPGHFIEDCTKKNATAGVTPYNGSRQSFGRFVCASDTCNQRWDSAFAFAGQKQFCPRCNCATRPKKMFSLAQARSQGLVTPAALQPPMPPAPEPSGRPIRGGSFA